MDEILASLDAVAPLRIAQKCDAFRKVKTFDAFQEQRAELLAASLLARAEIDFEFGRDHPDLEVDGGAWGIEVGTRKLDHPWLIHDLLEERLSDRSDLHVVLTFDGRPLGLGAKQVTDIVDAIAAESYPNGRSNRQFENAGLTVAVMTGTGVPESQVVLDFGARSGSELTDHLAEVEREIDNKIREKERQAGRMPTMLLLDFSRTGWAWLRPGPVWIPVLRSKIAGTPFVGLGLVISTLDRSLPMQLHAALDSERAPTEMETAFDKIAAWYHLAVEA
jgi:hypothetical protein